MITKAVHGAALACSTGQINRSDGSARILLISLREFDPQRLLERLDRVDEEALCIASEAVDRNGILREKALIAAKRSQHLRRPIVVSISWQAMKDVMTWGGREKISNVDGI